MEKWATDLRQMLVTVNMRHNMADTKSRWGKGTVKRNY